MGAWTRFGMQMSFCVQQPLLSLNTFAVRHEFRSKLVSRLNPLSQMREHKA